MATTKGEEGGEGGREAGAGREAKVRQWWGKAFGGCVMVAGNRRAFWKNKKCRKIRGRTSVVVNVDGRCGVREMGRSGARVGHSKRLQQRARVVVVARGGVL